MSRQKSNILPVMLAVLLLAFVVGVLFYVRDHRQDRDSSRTAGISSSNDNQALDSDLNNINNGLAQSSQDLQNSTNALNDRQLPVN